MKTKEGLNALRNEIEALNRKLSELSEDEMKEVMGGLDRFVEPDYEIEYKKEGKDIEDISEPGTYTASIT